MLRWALIYATVSLGFVPLLVFLYRGRSNPEVRFMLPFFWLLAVAALYEWVATILLSVNSTVWFRFYLLFEFLCLYYFFFHLLRKKYRYVFGFFLSVFLVVFAYLLTVWEQSDKYKTDSYLSIIETLFVFTCVFLWFRDIFKNLLVESLWKSPVFYFISAFILYFSGTIFLFLISDFIADNKLAQFNHYWVLNVALCFLLRILLIIGIWKGQTKSIQFSGLGHS